ncbi:type III-B CRISPR module-associated protein Cmr5 [Thermobifida cellulosilytica]|uniref:CRISPR type III-B/RAMP module-associated protein Cmr5 n=1 Tax=Thermobifida cellulosilytica TB100 TaxID=665004 RepID=A0A147KMV9_THECS|nr:type III-B CRISPR module-associated protein Cmr5 [Thermobifida cellulosilytica]KUP98587.1 hypothetical protein AC529_00610 [Thermobifida cellulosilytica TB100]
MAERVDQEMVRQAEKVIGPVVPDPQLAKRLHTRMRQFPMRLRSSGLAAAFAFAESRSGDGDHLERAYKRLCEAIVQHVRSRHLLELGDRPTARDFLVALSEADLVTYSRVSAEVDLLAGWLSRIADARYGRLAAAADRAEQQASGRPADGQREETP